MLEETLTESSGHTRTVRARQAAMFISHGAPSLALESDGIVPLLKKAGEHFTSASGVLILSAHWETQVLTINTNPEPQVIYDFGGFPPALYQLKYPAPGSPDLADYIINHLNQQNITLRENVQRGWDHGVWVPLRHLLPDAQLPIVQLSLPTHASASDMFAIGRVLGDLRDQGIAVIGSGSLTHNLYAMRFGSSAVSQEVSEFQTWVSERIQAGRFEEILTITDQPIPYQSHHPTDEHFLPLPFVLGAVLEDEACEVLDGGIQHYALSMRAFLWHA